MIKEGGWENKKGFMMSHGLKMWKDEDFDEARGLLDRYRRVDAQRFGFASPQDLTRNEGAGRRDEVVSGSTTQSTYHTWPQVQTQREQEQNQRGEYMGRDGIRMGRCEREGFDASNQNRIRNQNQNPGGGSRNYRPGYESHHSYEDEDEHGATTHTDIDGRPGHANSMSTWASYPHVHVSEPGPEPIFFGFNYVVEPTEEFHGDRHGLGDGHGHGHGYGLDPEEETGNIGDGDCGFDGGCGGYCEDGGFGDGYGYADDGDLDGGEGDGYDGDDYGGGDYDGDDYGCDGDDGWA
jgi:hypothetical protein